MRSTLLALSAVAVLGACSSNSPTAPNVPTVEGAPATAAAKVFPDQEHGGRPMTVPMTGEQEAPGPGDPDGTGTARFTFNPGQEEVCFVLEVSDIAPAAAAHIHIAPAGAPGPIVVPLTAPTSGSSSGCTSASRELIIAILQNPEAYYVNVHNAEFPGGAVRGQLSK
ncbi:MAG TPA: CHRD domain-containing protein [Vicinamibacterales bacterium]|nr:CHRD domain-containing protein [Vicinamibacterales bacterium]